MNPVLRKDLLGLLRLKRVAAVQVFFVAVLAALLLATWPQSGVVSIHPDAQDNLMLGLIIGQLVLLILFVPGIASVALTGEREGNTLEMLYASRLSALQIIMGKVFSALSFPLLLLISGLPFLAMLNYRGEVDAGKLLWAYLILVTAAMFLGMVSLTISAVCRQSATSLVMAYLVVLIICGGVLVPAAIMLENQQGLTAMALHYGRSISPIAAVLSLLRPQFTDFGGQQHQLFASWQFFLPTALAVMAGCLALLVAKLRKPPTSSEGFGAVSGSDEHRSLGRRIMFLIDPKKKRKPIGSFNPLIAKESRTSNLRSGRWMIRIFYGALFVSLGLAVMSLYGGAEHSDLLAYVAKIIVAFQFGVIALVVPSLTSSSISNEIESGTFEILRLSPLRGGQIFWGKFIPAFLPALLPVLALVPAYLAVWFIDPSYETRILSILPIILLSVIFCCTLGITLSSFISNTARATVAAYLVTAALFVLPMFAWWMGGSQLSMRLARWLAMPSPLVMAVNLLPEGTPEIERLYFEHLYLIGGLCVVMLLAARMRLTHLLRQG